MRVLGLVVLAAVLLLPASALLRQPGPQRVLTASNSTVHFNIPPREAFHAMRRRNTGMIQIQFVGSFPPEASAAFQFAADIWDTWLQLTQPIRVVVEWTGLGAGVLGSAGPTYIVAVRTALSGGDGCIPSRCRV
eukprot:m.267008 g.267008  ORF g.267008 m.267008 type:complete len:134 (-) comp11068_c1_seq5:1525-1926(-)